MQSWIKKIIGIGALLAIALSGCAQPGADGAQQAAAREFLTERNDGTPVALGADDGPTVVGVIEGMDGRTLTLKRPIDNASETIELAADARISQQLPASREALTVGQRATALGARSGETLDAQAIQLGQGALGPGGVIQIGPGVGPAGAEPQSRPLRIEPNASGQPGDAVIGGDPGMQAEPVSGVIERVDGDTLTLKQDDGASVTVRLSAATEISERRDVDLDALQPGRLVLASGTRSNGRLSAAQIELLPSPQP
jgi:hypothetical protein